MEKEENQNSTSADQNKDTIKEDDTKEPGTIIQEIQKGFTIKDRLLRPSLVGVSKKVTIKEEKTKENQENPENK